MPKMTIEQLKEEEEQLNEGAELLLNYDNNYAKLLLCSIILCLGIIAIIVYVIVMATV